MLLCKRKPSVVGSEFLANVGKGVGGRNAMHKKLCNRGVQVDGSGSRNEVEELGDFAVKRGCLNRLHGGEK